MLGTCVLSAKARARAWVALAQGADGRADGQAKMLFCFLDLHTLLSTRFSLGVWVWLALLALPCAAQTTKDDVPPPAAAASNWPGTWSDTLPSALTQATHHMGGKATDLLNHAMGLLGVPYKRGGNSEATGFDCSGFVRHLYETSLGRLLPRRASEQAHATETIERSELQPGDLVFFNTMKRAFSHVGVYLGDGKFIHAPRTGKSVQVDDMRAAYWQKRFNGARRVSAADAATDPTLTALTAGQLPAADPEPPPTKGKPNPRTAPGAAPKR